MKNYLGKLENLLPGLKKNIKLKKYTTFKIGGPAKYFFIAKNKKDIIKAVKAAKELKLPFFNLGEGSNLLVADKGFDGLVIKFESRKLKVKSNIVYAEAGIKLDDVVKLATKKSLTGLEWAVGIPGTVGGAVYGNAGAFNSLIADLIESVEVLDSKTLEIKNFSKKKCNFSNKNSIFKHKKNLIILSAVFKLEKGDKKEIQKKIRKYLSCRKRNHPFHSVSAGCIFKNYESRIMNYELVKKFPELKEFNKKGIIPAAFLIEKCGLKGKKIGDAEISKKHANFIINLGKAKAKDVLLLIKLTKEKVKNKFGKVLEEEIKLL